MLHSVKEAVKRGLYTPQEAVYMLLPTAPQSFWRSRTGRWLMRRANINVYNLSNRLTSVVFPETK